MFGKKIFYGWYVVAACLILIIIDGMLLYSFGIFLPYINDDYGLSRAAGSSLFSFRALVLAPSFIIAGRLIDKHDPRVVIFGGGCIAALGILLTGFATNWWELYISYGLFIGLGDAVLYITCVTVVSRWFVKKRALAIGIITTGVPLSGLITNPLIAWLINDFGYRNALFALAAIIFVALLSAFVLRGYPHELGLQAYGNENEPLRDTSTNNSKSTYKIVDDWGTREALSTPTYWLLYFMYFLAFITFLIIVTQFYNFEIDLGITALAAAGPPAAIGMGSIIGRTLLTSIMAEVFESRKVIFVCLLIQGSSIFILLAFGNIVAFYIFGFLFGFFYSAYVPLFPTLLGQFYGLKSLGTIYGIFGTSYSLAAIGGPLLAGYVHDIHGTYFYPFIVCIICCYVAAIGAYFIKAPKRRSTV